MAEQTPDTNPADAPSPGDYTLDPERTTIRADVKAMFGLLTVHGTFRLRSGQVSIAADPAASSVQASIEAGSFASGNATRDADVVSATLLDARPTRRSPSPARARAATAVAGWCRGR